MIIVNFIFECRETGNEIAVKARVHVGSTCGRGENPWTVLAMETDAEALTAKAEAAIEETAIERAMIYGG